MPLSSYLQGVWQSPVDDGAPVLDAVTGERVTSVSTRGRKASSPRCASSPRLRSSGIP